MRRHRSDTTQAAIVKALRERGYTVEIIGEPVDLAVRHYLWKRNFWIFAEAKTANRTDGSYVPDKKQEEQIQYCIRHCIPYWTTPEQAIEWLEREGKHVQVGR